MLSPNIGRSSVEGAVLAGRAGNGECPGSGHREAGEAARPKAGVGNLGTTGSIAGNVTNNATLAFSRSDAMTFSGVVSGTGTGIALALMGVQTASVAADWFAVA